MNTELWKRIRDYDPDSPLSVYGFSTRLANEHYWTKDFTEKAILEYKKFMYLAATSDTMVSPSGVVDVVWHQHLIFTQSYQEFCGILGKPVQHIPSTHNPEEAERFRQAKERTARYYREVFGEQPAVIWNYDNMYDSLELKKARFKLRTFLIAGILLLFLLVTPVVHITWPLYIQIGNPDFMIGYIAVILIVISILEWHNRRYLMNMVTAFRKDSFIYHLSPAELVYLQTGRIKRVVHATVNQLVEERKIATHPDHTLEAISNEQPRTREEYQVMGLLRLNGRCFYPALLQPLERSYIFNNTANCMEAFTKYFNKSKKFGRLFYINFIALDILLLLGIERVLTGILREKPVQYIGATVILFSGIIAVYLWWLTKRTGIKTITGFYKKTMLKENGGYNNREWQYFLKGNAAFTASFIPLANFADSSNQGSGVDSAGSSSCGSSCGGSCGGCGGG